MGKQYKKNDKRPKRKSVTTLNIATPSDGKLVVWIFDNIDRAGKFAFDISRKDFKPYDIMEKLIEYSSMTWADIKRQTHDDGKSKHHLLDATKLSNEAMERLKSKKLEEDSDSIFSFALQNKLRIVGIRKNEYFHVLWYDPNHEVCPSKKRNT